MRAWWGVIVIVMVLAMTAKPGSAWACIDYNLGVCEEAYDAQGRVQAAEAFAQVVAEAASKKAQHWASDPGSLGDEEGSGKGSSPLHHIVRYEGGMLLDPATPGRALARVVEQIPRESSLAPTMSESAVVTTGSLGLVDADPAVSATDFLPGRLAGLVPTPRVPPLPSAPTLPDLPSTGPGSGPDDGPATAHGPVPILNDGPSAGNDRSSMADAPRPGLPLGEFGVLANVASPPGAMTGASAKSAAIAPLEVPLEFTPALLLVTFALLAPVFVLYSRIRASRVLDSGNRRRALSFVAANPGATAADVARALGVHYVAGRYHLDVLVEFGHVTRVRSGPELCHFVAGARSQHPSPRAIRLLKRPENVAFLSAVGKEPGLTRELARSRLALRRTTAFRRAATLIEAGLLEERDQGLALTAAASTIFSAMGNGEKMA